MRRRADLGLHEAVDAICCGIVPGLHRAESVSSAGLLGWVPAFPAEKACRGVVELIRACTPKSRNQTRERLVRALRTSVPSWNEMITRAANSVLTDR